MNLLEARTLSKRYGAVIALCSCSLVVEPGVVHTLLGANGACMRTLVECEVEVVGSITATISVCGSEVRIGSLIQAARMELAPVFQYPALIPDLTIAQSLRL